MNGPPQLTPALYASRGRQPRSTSDSSPARQRNTDDLLSNLTPRTVVNAFRNPSGALKACIDAVTPAEQAFALRVAIASNSIHEWLEELSAWPWPAGGGPAGFKMATTKRRRDPRSGSEPSDNELSEAESYMSTIARYDRRIEEIGQGLDKLDIEEIKTQVLRNHIMPLSRPGTPAMDTAHARAASTIAATARMDDLTALVTTTTLQALPNLSKLSRLMDSWNFRIQVLRIVPVFLDHIADAEVALQAGQKVIGLGAKADKDQSNVIPSTLSRAQFEVMKPILERKVSKAGQRLDAMLDILEGQPDTLPEEWIDRVDALERAYGEWSVACERKIRETDLARMAREAGAKAEPEPQQPTHGTNGDAIASKQSANNGSSAFAPEEPGLDSLTLNDSGLLQDSQRQTPVSKPVIKLHLPPAEAKDYGENGAVLDLTSPTVEKQVHRLHGDCAGSDDGDNSRVLDGSHVDRAVSPEGHAEAVHGKRDERLAGARLYQPDSDSDLSDTSYVYQPGLPSLSHVRRDSSISESSTIVHEQHDSFTDSFCSDQFDQGTPERPRQRYMDPDATMNDYLAISDSSTVFRSSTRSMSVSFNDKPTITELPSSENPPSTPTKSPPIPEDDVLAEELDSPFQMSTPRRDDQLQQQISEILESVPARIRLKSEPPLVNLNPPDFKMPLTRKSSRPSDAIPRTQSNMSMRSAYSSRSGTPSFILAPAYGRNSRPRQQRSNQEIKVYHLSRSNGEAPIKLFIRCVGEHGERVMVRVGGGWADLGEYLKEYASHHGRRSGAAGGAEGGKVEVKDIPRTGTGMGMGTPPSRPTSAMDSSSPVGGSGGGSISPLKLRKTRRPTAASDNDDGAAPWRPKTPSAAIVPKPSLRQLNHNNSTTTPSPPVGSSSIRSRASSRISWDEEDSFSLGMAGPRAKQIEMSEESRAWVESVKEKVRLASGEHLMGRIPSGPASSASAQRAISQEELVLEGGGTAPRFGEIGRVGGTKRVFRRGP